MQMESTSGLKKHGSRKVETIPFHWGARVMLSVSKMYQASPRPTNSTERERDLYDACRLLHHVLKMVHKGQVPKEG